MNRAITDFAVIEQKVAEASRDRQKFTEVLLIYRYRAKVNRTNIGLPLQIFTEMTRYPQNITKVLFSITEQVFTEKLLIYRPKHFHPG